MHHISGNKSPMGSIGVPIYREYPHEENINRFEIAIHFYGSGWPSKSGNDKKEALKGPDR
jgi:hypothetical protein